MKIYVAGSRYDRDRVNQVQGELKKRGHIITHDWTQHFREGKTETDTSAYTKEELASYAMSDERGVREADLVVTLMLRNFSYRGVWTEVGIALGTGKLVILIGEYANTQVFAYHPKVIRFKTIEEFYDMLNDSEERWSEAIEGMKLVDALLDMKCAEL